MDSPTMLVPDEEYIDGSMCYDGHRIDYQIRPDGFGTFRAFIWRDGKACRSILLEGPLAAATATNLVSLTFQKLSGRFEDETDVLEWLEHQSGVNERPPAGVYLLLGLVLSLLILALSAFIAMLMRYHHKGV